MGPTEFHILFFFSSLSFLFLGNFFYFVLCNFCFIFYFGQRNYCISSSINLNRLNILCFITLIYIKTKYKIKSHLADPQNQNIYIYIYHTWPLIIYSSDSIKLILVYHKVRRTSWQSYSGCLAIFWLAKINGYM